MGKNVIVIGGANVDIVAVPDQELRMYDSNPGHALISFGGVGRNLAENLTRLGCNVRFVTIFGNDSFSRALRADTQEKGIDISLSKILPDAGCSKYICLNSHEGDMIAAINDMSLYDRMEEAITPEVMDAVNESDILVMDANTSTELLEKIADQCSIPIAFDAVSVAKVERCRNILDRLCIFKPNIFEAARLCKGETVYGNAGEYSEEESRQIAAIYGGMLRDNGVENVMISLGSAGVYYENAQSRGYTDSMVREIINTSGCGDAFLAGVIRGYLDGADICRMSEYGSAAAAICARSPETVSPQLSFERLFDQEA